MEMDFMGLNSKEEAIEAGGLENLNNHQLDENQKNIDPHGSGQLTIFYKGTVNIFDNMSPEKAHAIMLLAGNGAKAHSHAQDYADTPRTTTIGQPMNMTLSSPLSLGASITRDAPKKMNSFRRVMQSDVPQMREASLARFLEKRKERISGKPGSSSAPSKDDEK
ncbi:hypothetical protein E3N88_19792 [Mikania micrantha]|uniref:Protein TIFY n=1 Tax=Mikania micrantha TaxID=192012 RepID=A0A5N6NPC0_9ASTR|nr:hypothetical protein E3N88_19792 [Mikania micrantha]